MNTSRFQRVAWWPLAALLLLLAGACSRGSELEWTEDVKLPDGRVVALKRYTEFKGGSSQFAAHRVQAPCDG